MSKRSFAVDVPVGLGNRIKAARESKGWSQPELGKAVGVSKSAVSQWEKGAVQNLKLGNLFAVARALDKDVRELVFGAKSGVAEKALPATSPDVSPDQLELMRHYENLPKAVRQHIRGLILALEAATS